MDGDALRRALGDWYRANARDLPWRRSSDPYRIWVSEVMLQQTRVEAARPYYERFLEAFPTLEALAEAPLEEVLARWSGLGYYRRARALHEAVRECRERYGGEVPRDPEAFGGLKGVGPYTRAAVLSIAYEVPLAVVDGNVVRVLARRRGLAGHAREPGLLRQVQVEADRLLERERPGDSNQALMELGATVCTPRAPRCEACPWTAECVAGASGEPERWPAPAPRKQMRSVTWRAVLVERTGRVLLARREEGGARLAGMWELPYTTGPWLGLGERYGLELKRSGPVARIRHGILNERITLHVHRAAVAGDTPGRGLAWVGPDELDRYATSSVWRKALAAVWGKGARG